MTAPKISQSDMEIDGLIEILVQERVTRFLEIGSRFGGSLWRIAKALPKGSRIVSCDSGKGMGGRKPGAQQSLIDTVARLNADGYDAHLIIGHSQRSDTIAKVKHLGPYDAVFIDGDHELEGVTQDWQNYSRKARIVAFHDIAWQQPRDYPDHAKQVEVPILWDDLKTRYRHQEFIDPAWNMGIGVLWK